MSLKDVCCQVGALAVFLARHKTLMIGGDRSLAQVGRVIAINLVKPYQRTSWNYLISVTRNVELR